MKRRMLHPWPDNAWHSSGRVRKSISLQVIRQYLQDSAATESIMYWRDFTPLGPDYWWGFDAAWRTDDGHRIKARLLLEPDSTFVKKKKLTREDLETRDVDVEMTWSLTAEADGPWNLNWKSPLGIFADRRVYDWVSGRMPLMRYTGFTVMDAEHIQDGFKELETTPYYITVITHDKAPSSEVSDNDTGLVDLVPPSLKGRILEVRVFGDQDQIINADGVLPDSRLRLKWGGALILPTSPRQEAWPTADYMIRRPSGGNMEQLLKETAETVTRYAALQPHLCDRARSGLKDLRESWELPEIELAPRRILMEKREAEEEAARLRLLLEDARNEAETERKGRREAEQTRDVASGKLRELTESSLVKGARELQQQAEAAWQAMDASDALAERLAAEVAYLRSQLAQVPGRSYNEPVPEPQEGPSSWEELLQLTFERLPKVRVLDDVIEHLDKLDRHPKTKLWVRRTWTVLKAYQAYAEAKEIQGPEVLPRMQAYLRWEMAPVVFPESWHASKEVTLLKRDPKFSAMRTFRVERHGMVFMGEHVRVGGNRPPAPRMYLFDDTSGPTGLIHVGYIGPHLPNGDRVS
jgi:hypothetical protein